MYQENAWSMMINACRPDIDAVALMATPCSGSCFTCTLLLWFLHSILTCQVFHYKHLVLPSRVELRLEILGTVLAYT